VLTFLQLSDIHFSGRPDGSPYELDLRLRLRHELTRDAVAYGESLGACRKSCSVATLRNREMQLNTGRPVIGSENSVPGSTSGQRWSG
jgi:hypothetical protein